MDLRVFAELEELASQAGVQQKPEVRRLIKKAALWHSRKPKFTKTVKKKLLELSELEPSPYLRPPKGILEGPIFIGENRWSGKVGVYPENLAHSIIWGATQYGKTTLIAKIISQLIKNTKIATLCFDPKKSLRGLINHHPNIYPIRLDEFIFNPLSFCKDLPHKKRWISDFWGIICQGGDLLIGSKSFGFKVLNQLFRTKATPTMEDLLEQIEREQKKHPAVSQTYRYAERVKNRLEALLFAFGKAYDCAIGYPLEELLDPSSHLIFEWEGIDPDLAKTQSLLILEAIYHLKLATGDRGQGINLAIFIDEAEEFLGEDRRSRKLGVPFISKLLERGKELGIAIMAACHHTHINPAIRENASGRFCFNLSSAQDMLNVGKDMNLNQDQMEVIEELKVGEIVAKVKKRRWEEPFTVQVEPIKLDPVSDREVNIHNKEFMDQLSVKVVPKDQDKTKEDKQEESVDRLDLYEEMLLANINDLPFLNLSCRRKNLGWGTTKFNQAKKKLRDKGFIRQKKLRTQTKGAPSTLLELTSKGVDYLKRKGVKVNKFRGGIVHEYWMQKLFSLYKQKGYEVRKEVKLGEKFIDILAVDREGKRLAIEIECSYPKNTLHKLDTLLSTVDEVLIIADKKVLINQLKEGIKGIDHPGKVSLSKVQTILDG